MKKEESQAWAANKKKIQMAEKMNIRKDGWEFSMQLLLWR